MSSANDTGQRPIVPTAAHGLGGDIPVVARAGRVHAALSVRSLLTAAAWTTAGLLALTALGRLVHLDDAVGWPYPGINALTPLVYLPAYAVLAVGFALRRNLLMVISGLLIVLHLFWTVPELLPGSAEAAPAGSARLRVMTANLLYHNDRADRLGEQIRSGNPDLLVLAEVSPLTLERLRSSGALDDYRYSETRPQVGAFGSAIFSRFPLTDAAAPEIAGQQFLRATVQVDEQRRFVVYAVHTISPVNREYTEQWRAQLDTLREEVRAAELPVVMAGDFNATRDHRPFRRLTSAGVRDTHDVVGAGWTPTWNASSLSVLRLMRIDHVLASPAFAVTGYDVGDEFGSDHLPVTVDLALR